MKATVIAIAGFVVLLIGLFLAFGLPVTLMAAGGVAAVFGLVWESE